MNESGLTEEQEREAWFLLMSGGNNTDKNIASEIGVSSILVSDYLRNRSLEVLEIINNRSGNKMKIRYALNQIQIVDCNGFANNRAIKAVKYLQDVLHSLK